MKDLSQVQREVELVMGGLSDLIRSLTPKKPHSIVFIRGVLEDILLHASAAMFQIECKAGVYTELHQAAANS